MCARAARQRFRSAAASSIASSTVQLLDMYQLLMVHVNRRQLRLVGRDARVISSLWHHIHIIPPLHNSALLH